MQKFTQFFSSVRTIQCLYSAAGSTKSCLQLEQTRLDYNTGKVLHLLWESIQLPHLVSNASKQNRLSRQFVLQLINERGILTESEL